MSDGAAFLDSPLRGEKIPTSTLWGVLQNGRGCAVARVRVLSLRWQKFCLRHPLYVCRNPLRIETITVNTEYSLSGTDCFVALATRNDMVLNNPVTAISIIPYPHIRAG